jgi:uncharacterized protein (TIGR00297 family)
MLTRSGWISACLIAFLIIGSGLQVYLIYPISFLLLGSLATRLNPKNKDNSGRSAKQVFANSGVASILAIVFIFTGNQSLPLAFVISFSVALSDTFSSEFGKRFGGPPRNICSLKPIQKGLSGGITFIGTFAGLFGSFCVSIIYYFHTQEIQNCVTISVFGFAGMLIDSLIGCAFQAKYKFDTKIEEIGSRNNLDSGFHFIDNNMTNFLSILITVLLFLAIF